MIGTGPVPCPGCEHRRNRKAVACTGCFAAVPAEIRILMVDAADPRIRKQAREAARLWLADRRAAGDTPQVLAARRHAEVRADRRTAHRDALGIPR